jgi:hypothetical protein
MSKVEKNNKLTKIIILIITVLVSYVVIKGFSDASGLKKHPNYSKGRIVKFKSGGTSGGLHFSYPENTNMWDPVMSIGGQKCRKLITQNLNSLIKYEFPVVYSKKDYANAQLLIFKEQYEIYGLSIPDDVYDIVIDLSKCKQ